MLQWSSANKNKCSRKIGEKRVDFAPLFRIKLCFPSFLLDKVSQPIPYKGHRRWGKTNSGGHGSFLQMKALNFSVEQLRRIILKEKYFCKLVSRLRRLWGPEIKYAQVRQKMKGLYVGQWVEMTWNYSQPSVRELFANEMIQSTRNIDKISMETRLETREEGTLARARGIVATGVMSAPFVGKIEFFASCDSQLMSRIEIEISKIRIGYRNNFVIQKSY